MIIFFIGNPPARRSDVRRGRWLGVLLLVAAGCGKPAPRQESADVAPPAERESAPESKKGEGGPNRDELVDLSTDELVAVIQQSSRELVRLGKGPRTEGRDASLRAAVVRATGAANRILADPSASADQKAIARQAKLACLYTGARAIPIEFERPMDAFVDELVETEPNGALAALGWAYRIEKDYMSANATANALPALRAYAQRYPRNPTGLELFENYGRKLESEQEPSEAIEVYQTALNTYGAMPAAETIRRRIGALSESRRAKTSRLRSLTGDHPLIGKTLQINGPLLDGHTFRISEISGKLVLVDFWATWCGPCRAKLPELAYLYRQFHARGLEVVGVSLDRDKAALAEFCKATGIPWRQVIFHSDSERGWNNPLANRYQIHAIPALFLLDRAGKVIAANPRASQLESFLKQELSKTP